jgi:hypothetical protein
MGGMMNVKRTLAESSQTYLELAKHLKDVIHHYCINKKTEIAH